MADGNHDWDDSKLLARAVLQDRGARRRWMSWMLVVALLLMAAGLWVLDDVLARDPLWFLLWWAACAGMTSLVLAFAVYDALAVWREERRKLR